MIRRLFFAAIAFVAGLSATTFAAFALRANAERWHEGPTVVVLTANHGLHETDVVLLAAAASTSSPEGAIEAGGSSPAPVTHYDEYAISAASIQRGKEEETMARMAAQGWELVREETSADGSRYIFRRPTGR